MSYLNRGKKKTDMMTVNIGELLQKVINERKLQKSAIARKIDRANGAVNPLLRRPSMQTYLLWEISEAIEYNFFHEIAQALDEKTNFTLANGNEQAVQKLAEKDKEIEKLKLEVEILKDILKGGK